MVLEKALESPLDCKEIPILKEISPGCSLEGLMLKLKRQYFGHLMLRAEMTEDEMVGWHHRLDELESGCTSGVGDGQGGLAYCGS